MHVQVLIRGVYSQCELWKSFAQSQFFRWRRKLEDGSDAPEVLVQMALRPSVFGTYELIIPEEALPTLLSMLSDPNGNKVGCKRTIKNRLNMVALRTMCGVKKIPQKTWDEAKTISPTITLMDTERGLSNFIVPGVTVHVLGIKKDARGEMVDPADGITYIQELL